MNIFSTLRNNVKMFPKFALLTLVVAILTLAETAGEIALCTHSLSRSINFAALLLAIDIGLSFVLFYLISLNSAWYGKCQQFADSFAQIFLRSPVPATDRTSTDNGDEEEETEPEEEEEEIEPEPEVDEEKPKGE
jgi:hypothetical protein